MTNSYDQKYAGGDFYWGNKPSSFCVKVLEIMQPTANFRPKLLDYLPLELRAEKFAQYQAATAPQGYSFRLCKKAFYRQSTGRRRRSGIFQIGRTVGILLGLGNSFLRGGNL